MRRLLVVVLILYLVWRVLAIVGRSLERRSREISEEGFGVKGPRKGEAGPEAQRERLVPCAHCGTLVPASRALSADGASWCSPRCRDAARGDGDAPAP